MTLRSTHRTGIDVHICRYARLPFICLVCSFYALLPSCPLWHYALQIIGLEAEASGWMFGVLSLTCRTSSLQLQHRLLRHVETIGHSRTSAVAFARHHVCALYQGLSYLLVRWTVENACELHSWCIRQ